MQTVPNWFPHYPSPLRLALVGEAPGSDEERIGRPFVGASGRFLAALLSRAGHSIDSCFLGNVSQHRPPNNKIELFKWNGPEIQHGLEKLRSDIQTFKPNIVCLLGNTPLKAAMEPTANGKAHFKNAQWRGSLFRCEEVASPFFGFKCMCTFHPAYILRDKTMESLLMFDLERAVKQSASHELHLPVRTISIAQSANEVQDELNHVRDGTPMAVDIEGYPWAMSCIGFAGQPGFAYVIPFLRKNGSRYWGHEDEKRILRLVAAYLEDPEVPKVFMNGIYDRFILQYCYNIHVRNVVQDIMLTHWELYADLAGEDKDKRRRKVLALALQASIYTEEPFYKTERETLDDEQFYRYNGKDCCVTLEIAQKHYPMMRYNLKKYGLESSKLNSITHAKFNNDIVNPLLYMMNQGIRYDKEKASSRRLELQTQLYAEQATLNALTGHCLNWKTKAEINSRISEVILVKKGDRPYADKVEDSERLSQLFSGRNPNLSTVGEVENLLEVSLSVESPKQFNSYLYETLALPTQYNDDKENPRPTSDYEALLKLSRISVQESRYSYAKPILESAIRLRALSTRQSALSISTDTDGRIRCGYNPCGSSTGRVNSRESVTGSGTNLQTIPNYTEPSEAPGGILGDRDLFLADRDCWLFQCDLAGADGWTVASYSAMLGDETMLDDYRAGLRPFNNICLMLRGVAVDFKDRQALREAGKKIEKDSWDRFACKRVQHGASYLEGGLTISRNILKDSEGKLYMTPTECDKLKDFFFQRYWGVKKWHDWVARRLKEKPVLTAASGQVRQFFGRPDEILTKAVAFEPQANTTYATNLALLRLWTDLDNRETGVLGPMPNSPPKEYLKIKPIHQVHDALVGQFRKDCTSWAISKIKQWFDNPLTIAGQTLTIPFDGGFGPSWGELNVGKI